jgi:hypothetical protein
MFAFDGESDNQGQHDQNAAAIVARLASLVCVEAW